MISKNRISIPDIAKGIAIILMIQVHLIEVFAKPSVYYSIIGKISLFLGGPLVAPVFLLILGYFLAVSDKRNIQLITRGVILFTAGILLNIGLNLNLFLKVNAGELNVNIFEFIFGVDILSVAGLSIVLITLLKIILQGNKKYILYISLALPFIIVITTPYINLLSNTETWFKYIYAYLGGNYKWSYFPLFPWLAYPLLGYGFLLLNKKFDLNKILKKEVQIILTYSTVLITLITGIWIFPQIIDLNLYYHHNFLLFLWIVMFIILFLNLLKIIENEFNHLSIITYIKWMGKNVTTIYIIQWLIIGNIGTSVYKKQSLSELIIWFPLIVIATTLLTFVFNKAKDQVSSLTSNEYS